MNAESLDLWRQMFSRLVRDAAPPDFPAIVCLCGSTRFKDAFVKARLQETLAGKIVLTIGCDLRADAEIFGGLPPGELDAVKLRLDELHFRKIELADEVLILNVGGYVGHSTHRELCHAIKLGKVVRFLEPPGAEIRKDLP